MGAQQLGTVYEPPSDLLVDTIKQDIITFLTPLSGFNLALLSTSDGIRICDVGGNSTLNLNKISAISGSIFLLVSALTKECGLPSSRQLILDTPLGKIIVAACNTVNHQIVLLVLLDEEATLAQFNFAVGQLTAKAALLN